MTEGAAPVDLTIVVVTYNSQSTIRKCLESLVRYAPTRFSWRIVVVDNASRDASVEIVRTEFPGATVIANKDNLGFGVGNNIGMSAMPARYYYLHNADAYLQEAVLDDALLWLDAHRDVGIAGLPLVFPDGSPQSAAYPFSSARKWLLQEVGAGRLARAALSHELGRKLLMPVLGRFGTTRRFAELHGSDPEQQIATGPIEGKTVDWVCGAALILSADAHARTNGFDPDIFLYGEDEDLCLRATASGARIVQLNTVPVIHDFGWGKTGKASPVVKKLKYESMSYFVSKHFSRKPLSRAIMQGILKLQSLR